MAKFTPKEPNQNSLGHRQYNAAIKANKTDSLSRPFHHKFLRQLTDEQMLYVKHVIAKNAMAGLTP